jgi:hypothetical protein
LYVQLNLPLTYLKGRSMINESDISNSTLLSKEVILSRFHCIFKFPLKNVSIMEMFFHGLFKIVLERFHCSW